MPGQQTTSGGKPFIGLPEKQIKLPNANSKLDDGSKRGFLDVNSSRAEAPRPGRASPLGITLDTNVSDHQAPTPEQLYPPSRYEKTGGSFPSKTLPSKKKKGHVPAPLDLEQELSPFDRYVPIVLSNPNTPGSTGIRNRKQGQAKPITPTIIVSPAVSSPAQASRAGPATRQVPRPASSVYTRAMSSISRAGLRTPGFATSRTPPVPRIKIPFAAAGKRPASEVTVFQDGPDSAGLSQWLSPDINNNRSVRESTETVLPTPRRSKGWWNLLSPVTPRIFSTPKRSFTAPARIRHDDVGGSEKAGLPFLDRAAPMAESNPRGADEKVDWPLVDSPMQRPGTQRTIPTRGEAAKYYYPEFDYGRGDEDVRGAGLGMPMWPANDLANEDQKGAIGAGQTRDLDEPPAEPKPKPVAMVKPPDTITPTNGDEEHANRSAAIASPPAAPVNNKRTASDTPTTKPTPSSLTTLSPAVVQSASLGRVHNARDIHAKSLQGSTLPPVREAGHKRAGSGSSDGCEHSVALVRIDSSPDPRRLQFFEHMNRSDHDHEQRAISHEKIDTWRNDPALEPREKVKIVEPTVYERYYPAEQHQHQYRFAEPVKSKLAKAPRKRWSKERLFLLAVACGILLMMLLSLILAMTVVQHHTDMPVTAAWLNLTDFPPLPTGIATVAQPNAKSDSSCVDDENMWSCAMPKEQQDFIRPNAADQPNFRIEIRYSGKAKGLRNSTTSGLTRRALRSSLYARSMGGGVRRDRIERRDGFTDIVNRASPAPPSKEDQAFLGNTTDKVDAPYAGEDTPFTISLLPLTSSSSPSPKPTLTKRSTPNNTTNPYTLFPKPHLSGNGTATPPLLYPLPVAQPLRLFNRGKQDEHYGFYTYFDRSLFLSLSSTNNTADSVVASTNTGTGGSVDNGAVNENGGAEAAVANALCTWTQTRFLVQLWTRAAGVSPSSTTPSTSAGNNTATANAFTRPGSFPYAVTISLDRHGGDARKKAVFCLGLGEGGKVLEEQKALVDEDRGFGGVLLNGADGPFMGGEGAAFERGQGGVDGGSGGCSCRWSNW